MRDRWNALDTQARTAITIALGFVGLRVALASLSGFGFHQGWNEGHYALVAAGFLEHPLVPKYGDRLVYNVPPLFPYTVSTSFLVFGKSTLAARLPSILATGGLVVATYELGRSVYGDRSVALVGAATVATLPYVQLYGGRAQTDALMVFLATASVTAIVRGYRRETNYRRWLVAGGALFAAAVATKQPAVLVAGIVLLWLVGNRRFDREAVHRTGLLIGASALFLLPLFAWFYLNYLAAPTAFVADWRHELFGRTHLFANARLLAVIAFGLGMTPPVLAGTAVGLSSDLRDAIGRYRRGARDTPGPSILTWWLLLYGAFVFARTPHGHQYYAVALAPPIALLSARSLSVAATRLQGLGGYGREAIHLTLVVLVLASAVAGTVVLFELSGEFSLANGGGTHVASDAGDFVASELPDDATVLVSNGYAPPVKWYASGRFPIERIEAYRVSTLSENRIRTAVAESEGPVYLVYPSPAWSDLPTTQVTQVHATPPYEYTLMAVVGSHVDTNSKFTFYLNDRQLVVYRVDASNNRADNGRNARKPVFT